jgi:hypothetical protein
LLFVDLDATLVAAHSELEQAAPTFKQGFGHHPVRREAGAGNPNGCGCSASAASSPQARNLMLYVGDEHRWTELALTGRAAITGLPAHPADQPLCLYPSTWNPTGPWTWRHRPSGGEVVVLITQDRHRHRPPSRETITTSDT